MDKTELDSILSHDTGPIEPYLDALADEAELPRLALAMCTARIEEAAPALLQILEKAADGLALSEREDRLLFRGLHILGGARRQEAFAPLLRFLTRPGEELDPLLGDAMTKTLPRIVVGVFNGDRTALFAAIEDAPLDEFVRNALFGAAAFLAWERRIDRGEMTRFLARFFDSKAPPPRDHAWVGWADAIALLGERELADRVRTAFAQGLVDGMVMSIRHFEEALAEAERAPDDDDRFRRAHHGYIEDVLVELEAFPDQIIPDGFDADDLEDAEGEDIWTNLEESWAPPQPAVNPLRHIGRNDPCPCGSGKKFKKCCLR